MFMFLMIVIFFVLLLVIFFVLLFVIFFCPSSRPSYPCHDPYRDLDLCPSFRHLFCPSFPCHDPYRDLDLCPSFRHLFCPSFRHLFWIDWLHFCHLSPLSCSGHGPGRGRGRGRGSYHHR